MTNIDTITNLNSHLYKLLKKRFENTISESTSVNSNNTVNIGNTHSRDSNSSDSNSSDPNSSHHENKAYNADWLKTKINKIENADIIKNNIGLIQKGLIQNTSDAKQEAITLRNDSSQLNNELDFLIYVRGQLHMKRIKFIDDTKRNRRRVIDKYNDNIDPVSKINTFYRETSKSKQPIPILQKKSTKLASKLVEIINDSGDLIKMYEVDNNREYLKEITDSRKFVQTNTGTIIQEEDQSPGVKIGKLITELEAKMSSQSAK